MATLEERLAAKRDTASISVVADQGVKAAKTAESEDARKASYEAEVRVAAAQRRIESINLALEILAELGV